MQLRTPVCLVLAIASGSALAEDRPSRERQAAFLETAPIVHAKPLGTGVTDTWRLTLEDEELTHDASFQYVDERVPVKRSRNGRVELNFVDSYRYNIAAYLLAELIGLGDMVPVTVKRSWRGKTGALSWWVDDVAMDENEMKRRELTPPDPVSWSHQIFKVRVFATLVQDSDRNRGNLLITRDWKISMIDFTRAFRRKPELGSVKGLVRCDAVLLERLRELGAEQVEHTLGAYLSKGEIGPLLRRRDLLVEYYDARIREVGRERVLY